MVGLGKPQLHAKFEVASFSQCTNIKGEPQIFGSKQMITSSSIHFEDAIAPTFFLSRHFSEGVGDFERIF